MLVKITGHEVAEARSPLALDDMWFTDAFYYADSINDDGQNDIIWQIK